MVHGMGKNSCPMKKVLEKIDRFEVWVIRCIGRFREWFSFYFCLCWRQKAVTEMFLKTKITSSAKPTLTFSISSVRIHVKIIQPVFLTVVEVWLMRLTNVRVWKVNILWLIKKNLFDQRLSWWMSLSSIHLSEYKIIDFGSEYMDENQQASCGWFRRKLSTCWLSNWKNERGFSILFRFGLLIYWSDVTRLIFETLSHQPN